MREVLSRVQVFLHFPEIGWIKVNIDIATNGAPGVAACGGTCTLF